MKSKMLIMNDEMKYIRMLVIKISKLKRCKNRLLQELKYTHKFAFFTHFYQLS